MTSSPRWRPEDQIVIRCVWSDKIADAWPVTIVKDSPGRLVLYLYAGRQYKFRDFGSTSDARLPLGNWTPNDDPIWKPD